MVLGNLNDYLKAEDRMPTQWAGTQLAQLVNQTNKSNCQLELSLNRVVLANNYDIL